MALDLQFIWSGVTAPRPKCTREYFFVIEFRRCNPNPTSRGGNDTSIEVVPLALFGSHRCVRAKPRTVWMLRKGAVVVSILASNF
jgi:hypothetical protein